MFKIETFWRLVIFSFVVLNIVFSFIIGSVSLLFIIKWFFKITWMFFFCKIFGVNWWHNVNLELPYTPIDVKDSIVYSFNTFIDFFTHDYYNYDNNEYRLFLLCLLLCIVLVYYYYFNSNDNFFRFFSFLKQKNFFKIKNSLGLIKLITVKKSYLIFFLKKN